MKKLLLLALGLLAVCTAVFAGGEKEVAAGTGAKAAPGTEAARGITINPPELTGFSESGASDLPGYVQGILSHNFEQYSGMTVSSWGDVPDYILDGRLERHSSTRFSISLTVKKGDTLEILATSEPHFARSLDMLKFGDALNLATKDILSNPKLGVTLTAEAGKALAKSVDTKYGESVFALAMASSAPAASFKSEQNANVAEELGQNLEKAGVRLSESAKARFVLPEFNAPAGFTALTFKPPAIRTFSTSATVEGIQANVAQYREIQAANKAAIEERQQYLLGQRDAILDQWQDFLGEAGKRREILHEEEQKLIQVQSGLEAELREGEAYYQASPPFRILYDPKPEMNIDFERETADMRFQIAAEPTSIKALKVRLDNLVALNKSFASVNKAYEDVNTAVAARFAEVETAMTAVKDAMNEANVAGSSLRQDYRVAPMSTTSIEWNVPSGSRAFGRALKTSWAVDYPRSFDLTVSLLVVRGEDDADVIERQSLSLTSDTSWNGPLKPESAFVRGAFNNVNIANLGEGGALVVWVEAVNGIDAETAAMGGYIEIIPDEARTAAVRRQTAARESWRNFWSDTGRLNSLGVAAGTTGGGVTPVFLVSPKLTFSPFSYSFVELGADLGLAHGERDVQGVEYFSIAPYMHFNLYAVEKYVGAYVGAGGGASFSRYDYPSESGVDPVTVLTPVFDVNVGFLAMFPHSGFDLRYTIKTNFEGTDHRFTLGYVYRFGYFAARYGGNPARLTNQGTNRR